MVSVIIPCYATPETAHIVGQQLWYTVASAISALEGTGEKFEILAVMNGQYPMSASIMHQTGSVNGIWCGPNVNSPQSARHHGFSVAKGDVLFSLDAHVLVAKDFFTRVLSDMAETGADFMGAAHRFLSPNFYAHRIDWGGYLWGADTIHTPPDGDKPFRVAVHPHGAFAITAKAYRDVGGYWLALNRFGGEETQLCFKLWLMGKTVWATPRTYHWHWLAPGDRRGPELFEDRDFVRNFLLVAAAYAGDAQVWNSYKAFQMHCWSGRDLYATLPREVIASPEVARERALVAERGKYKSIAELREMFDREGVLN